VRADWEEVKYEVMWAALQAKFAQHSGPRGVLRHTASLGEHVELIEDAPHDYVWGGGGDSTGKNSLGVMLMKLRDELVANGQ
jgi:ribA/ribD-fused uncharacterized protein